MRVWGKSFTAVSWSHWLEHSCTILSSVVLTWSSVQILAFKCALKQWSRNSSPVLNTFTALSTCFLFSCSRRLHRLPGCIGVPHKIMYRTFRHSQRKWKSPAFKVHNHAFYTIALCIGLFPNKPHLAPHWPMTVLSFCSISPCLHSLHPLMTLHVNWSPTTTFCVHTFMCACVCVHVCVCTCVWCKNVINACIVSVEQSW